MNLLLNYNQHIHQNQTKITDLKNICKELDNTEI